MAGTRAGHRVFVYGTLRAGEDNHRLLRGALYLGTHRTPSRYTMLDLGGYPGVIAGRTRITGEVYAVDPRTFAALDRLEEHPRVYTRVLIPSPYGKTWLYIYRGHRARRRVVPSGDWCPGRRG
ncbi:MAG: gamma-glutamylcyclotransferase [Gammaproteobacteria bacterium]|nr:gamma-glutamylcyclotransferase [Gammaproteobacteria bacterium]NIR98152.1 gamma-glutamylcyclotransferase [Gammaproteobacteria bacterium]NIT62539.1 gamma-glutamylcyclotransferase [Gammaproteobacteria bacterium]NIV20796.1 gamma-glutamylcyclotransferase [Gammaproteobacteria bacterium]NIY31119.1 gamma-glutamylcyclotransferase [Gammaproteobacteria bacterium]